MLETPLVDSGVEVPVDPEGRVVSDYGADQGYWFEFEAAQYAGVESPKLTLVRHKNRYKPNPERFTDPVRQRIP